MEILEKILTGNLGYGTVILIVTLFIGVYYQFILPRLNKADSLEEKKNKEIADLAQTVIDKDIQIASSLEAIAKHIELAEENSASQKALVESVQNLTSMSEFSKNVEQMGKELERYTDRYDKDHHEIKQEIKVVNSLVERLKEDLETKIEPLIKDRSTDVDKAIERVENLLRDFNSTRYSEQNQLGTNLSKIMTELSDLKAIISSLNNERIQGLSRNDGTMQGLK